MPCRFVYIFMDVIPMTYKAVIMSLIWLGGKL